MSAFLEIKDGFYILPERASLYRGDNSIYNKRQHVESIQFDDKITYFCYTADAADQYGVVFEFKADKEYKLLALDKPEMMELFYRDSPENIQRILKNRYGFISGIRDSIVTFDNELSNYLRDKGYDGYATDFMPTSKVFKNEDGKYPQFHQEIMLCHPENLQFFDQITTDPSVIYDKLSKNTIRILGVKEKERPPSLFTQEYGHSPHRGSPKGNNLFGDSPSPQKKLKYHSPPHKGNNLFGFNTPGGKGKKTIKRNPNKKSKSYKKRKSHKKRKTN